MKPHWCPDVCELSWIIWVSGDSLTMGACEGPDGRSLTTTELRTAQHRAPNLSKDILDEIGCPDGFPLLLGSAPLEDPWGALFGLSKQAPSDSNNGDPSFFSPFAERIQMDQIAHCICIFFLGVTFQVGGLPLHPLILLRPVCPGWITNSPLLGSWLQPLQHIQG